VFFRQVILWGDMKPTETNIVYQEAPPGYGSTLVRLCCLLMLLVMLSACNPVRAYEAALVLSDIAAGNAPTRLKSVTPPPRRTAVAFPAAGKTVGGDLYLPGLEPLAALLLIPGAAEKGKDDPRVQAFAGSLARARFAVLVPDFESFRLQQVSSRDIDETADALAWLAGRQDLAPGGRCGAFSFSYASGPVLIATLRPQVAGRVKFLMAVGGYYSAPEVLTFFTTGYYRDQDSWRHMEPNSYGKWIFISSNVRFLANPVDRMLFQEAARRKMVDLNSSVLDLASRLSPEGRRVYEFVENRDRTRAQPLMDHLPESIRREIKALDLSGYDLSRLGLHAILVHGYDDDIIPYTQSVALAKHLPGAQLFLVHGLKHVDLHPGLIDKLRLWRAISALLRERG
jgi:pimeloyl-ACP methyl ester carboxylesterase